MPGRVFTSETSTSNTISGETRMAPGVNLSNVENQTAGSNTSRAINQALIDQVTGDGNY